VSWVLAMTFCVILAAWFIRPPKDPSKPSAPLPWLMSRIGNLWSRRRKNRPRTVQTEEPAKGIFFRIYGSLLGFALKHRVLTLATAFGALMLTTQLPVSAEFFPLTERNQFAVDVRLPESASIEQTNKIARQVENMIRKCSPYVDETGQQRERLANMRTIVGGGGARWYLSWEPEASKPNYAEILIHTTDGAITHQFAEELRRVIDHGDEKLGLQPIVGARVIPIELFLGPPADPVVLRIVGNGFTDLSEMRSAANQVGDRTWLKFATRKSPQRSTHIFQASC